MITHRFLLVSPFLLLTLWVSITKGAELRPGSPAPEMSVKEWLKGDPIDRLDSKSIYVIEFWATWCAPCLESIPHLSKLAKQHPDVTFIGVSVLEESKDNRIKRFVENMGDKMAYRVAYSGNKEGMAATWLKASSQDGIPTAYIVANGKIMWIGHPINLDKPLSEIKKGTFDLSASNQAFDDELRLTKKRMEANEAFLNVVKIRQSGQKNQASDALTQAVKNYPRLAKDSERVRYEWMAEDDPKAWLVKTEELTNSGKPENLQMVCSFALRSAQIPEGWEKARTAMTLAIRGCKNEEWSVLQYARTVYLKLGDNEDALRVTNRMLEIYHNGPAKDNPSLKEALTKSKTELETKLGKGNRRD